MDDRLSKPKRKPAKSAQPSNEEKAAMTAELEKAHLMSVLWFNLHHSNHHLTSICLLRIWALPPLLFPLI
jgi:hypothetical protein